MKLPRDVSSKRLIRHLERNFGYRIVGQEGSHIILQTEHPRHHRLPIPERTALGTGIFSSIVRAVSNAQQISRDDFLRDL